jgi:hypothetical protein
MKAREINKIFRESIEDYHVNDHVDTLKPEKYEGFQGLLYLKNWIDTVQWHLEDLIRDPQIEPGELVGLKRRIDSSNQHRTDTVEQIDEYLYQQVSGVNVQEGAKLNSETPAWLLDRMSILQLKIYHFQDQLKREDADESHLASVKQKLYILQVQEQDLELAYDELMDDLHKGKKYMKLYKQMKMYNDPNLNPIFYDKK